MARQHRVTIKEIAQMCGVSMQTVSRVINNRPDVSPETRRAVEAAIATVGFEPSEVARSLVQRRSQTLGVIATGLRYFGVAQILNGITEASHGAGYALLLEELPREDRKEVAAAARFLIAHRVEGIILFAPPDVGSAAMMDEALPATRPPVVLLKSGPRPSFTTIAVDNRAGARLATEHLLSLGRGRIAHLGGPRSWQEARDRADGWRDALAAAHVKPGPVVQGDWTSASGERAFLRLLERDRDMDAVFVANDQMALGALHAAHQRGVAIPGRVAVVGFDGLPEGEHFIPSLTTVTQPLREQGALAVRELLSAIEDDGAGASVQAFSLSPSLLVRESAPSPA
jgi:LacI family transcriptional regulator